MPKKQVSMIRKYHDQTPQIKQWCAAPRGRAKEHGLSQDTRKKSSLLFIKMIAKLDGHKLLNNETRTKHRTHTHNGSSLALRISRFNRTG